MKKNFLAVALAAAFSALTFAQTTPPANPQTQTPSTSKTQDPKTSNKPKKTKKSKKQAKKDGTATTNPSK